MPCTCRSMIECLLSYNAPKYKAASEQTIWESLAQFSATNPHTVIASNLPGK